jgi:hypothetical protein
MTPDSALMHHRWELFAMVKVGLKLVVVKERYPKRGSSRDKQAWSNTLHACRHLAPF